MIPFSKRQNLKEPEAEITIRNDAPEELREAIIQIIYGLNYTPKNVRTLICRVLKVLPDKNNWGEPNISNEVESLIEECQWYKVYDIIESFYAYLETKQKPIFSDEINDFFREKGIGWKLENGQIETRGDKEFETDVSKVLNEFESKKQYTSKNEMEEAIRDLSRRPDADVTGAIQHSIAALECLSREVSGDKKSTLGALIIKHPELVPKPLDDVISKIWGFSSEQGRHLKEDNPPKYIEAELLVHLSAALCSYLCKKIPS